MSIFARFRLIEENGKAQAVRSLMESSTPNFDYFYMVMLAVAMATLGLIAGSAGIVIGSMLISPVLFPLLSFSLGLVMSDYQVLMRSFYTILKSMVLGIGMATAVTLIFGFRLSMNPEILSRTEPSLIYLFVAVVAGLAVSYAMVKPEWNETIPGIAISVALIPPLATVGIGLARLDMGVAIGALILFIINFIGIVLASTASFSLMNLYDKRNIAQRTLHDEEQKERKEKAVIEAIDEEERVRTVPNTPNVTT